VSAQYKHRHSRQHRGGWAGERANGRANACLVLAAQAFRLFGQARSLGLLGLALGLHAQQRLLRLLLLLLSALLSLDLRGERRTSSEGKRQLAKGAVAVSGT
jgi:hypothetical protein